MKLLSKSIARPASVFGGVANFWKDKPYVQASVCVRLTFFSKCLLIRRGRVWLVSGLSHGNVLAGRKLWTMGDSRWFGNGRKNKKNGRTYETGGGRDSAAARCRVP